jgi:hypothetical protein
MTFSRVRMLALCLVAVFSLAAFGATTVASASDASTSASKKSKKCKKGYKKTKGKCKKPKGSKGKAFVAALGSAASSTDATTAKKKKCKKGYKRINGKGKCKRKPFVITPDSITLVAGVLKKGQFGATGYSYFPSTSREAVLKGYWHISNGIGFEKLKVDWNVAKGQNFTNFTDTQRKVGLSGPNMTATLVVQGVRSNAFALKQD